MSTLKRFIFQSLRIAYCILARILKLTIEALVSSGSFSASAHFFLDV
jgi:hypothetical protein